MHRSSSWSLCNPNVDGDIDVEGADRTRGAPGSYAASAGKSECDTCDEGKFSGVAAAVCIVSDPGYEAADSNGDPVTSSGGGTQQIACAIGKYSPWRTPLRP